MEGWVNQGYRGERIIPQSVGDQQIGEDTNRYGSIDGAPVKEEDINQLQSGNRGTYREEGLADPNRNHVFENPVHLQNYLPFQEYHSAPAANQTISYLPPLHIRKPPQTGNGVYLDERFYSYDGLSGEQVGILNTLPPHHQAYVVKISKGIFYPTDLIKLDDFPHIEEQAIRVRHDNNWGAKANIESIIKDFANTSEIWSRCFLNYCPTSSVSAAVLEIRDSSEHL